jgi:hypothetical protein
MRIPTASILILAVCSSTPWGQAEQKYYGHGYAYTAPGFGNYRSGQRPSAMEFGGGGEVLVHKGLTIGADIGRLHVDAAKYSIESNLILLSVNGAYHFGARKSGAKVVPFITWGGGYGWERRQGGGSGTTVNLGGGVQYWFQKRMALRLEVRDTFLSENFHHLGFRVGLAFR